MTVTKGGHANEFSGKFRKIFWPIHNHELKKFLPMVVMMFCFLFNYTIMRDTKDTLIVTAAGAEAIPFLKFWGTLPMSILFVIAYAKLSNVLKATTLFYTVITPFLIFFASFGFLIYPNIELFSPVQAADALQNIVSNYFPTQMQATFEKLVAVFRVWPYALFYILSELWGSMGISLLFWQFANHITKPEEAKRFYAGFGQLGNLALVASGLTIIYFSDVRSNFPSEEAAWGHTLNWLMGAISVGCVIIIATYNWMNNNILTDARYFDGHGVGNKKKSKTKLSIMESFLYLSRSKYLGCIALLVLGYGVSINLIEVVWKAQLGKQFPNENDYNTFMGYFSMYTGIATLLLVTVGSNIIRSLGWRIAALAAPIMILITGAIFFVCVMYKNEVSSAFLYLGLACTPLWMAVIMGAVQNILSKATKYSLFDPTKEMAYIPLDSESKIKGKAAIDVVGARLGKSGGGIILQVVLLFGAIADNLPVLLFFVGLIVAAWIFSVVTLNKLYQQKLREHELEIGQHTTVNTAETTRAVGSTGTAGTPAAAV
ncbi:MAG: Npt1/Npt2 family nucleotide transporter [Gammaproteobacteria bacterium]